MKRRLGVAAPFALAVCVAFGGSVESAQADDGVKTAPLSLDVITIIRTPTLEALRAANAAESAVAGSFRWRADGNGVEIIDAIDKKATEMVVPSEIDGKPVTKIGDGAFVGCRSLSSLTLPAGVTSIGDGAFAGCFSLSSLTLPTGLTSIGDGAFSGCAALATFDVSEENRFFRSVDGVLFTKDGKTLVRYPADKAATEYAIPDGVETIAPGAFEYCAALTAISIPDGVVEIGDMAFNGCKSLESLTLPDGVKPIGEYALTECDALRTVRTGDGLETIGRRAFGVGGKQAVALTVYGPAGSVAEEYARENGLRFEAVDAKTATSDADDGE